MRGPVGARFPSGHQHDSADDAENDQAECRQRLEDVVSHLASPEGPVEPPNSHESWYQQGQSDDLREHICLPATPPSLLSPNGFDRRLLSSSQAG